MRFFLVLLFVFFLSEYAIAQKQEQFGVYKHRPYRSLYVEFVGGTVFPVGDANVSVNNFDNGINLSHNEGISVRYQLFESLSFGSQLTYSGRGMQFGRNNSYTLKTSHVGFYLPTEYQVKLSKIRSKVSSSMLFYAGPYVINNLSGSIHSIANVEKLNSDEMSQWDYGLETGLGFRVPVFSMNTMGSWSFKASYFHGMVESLAGISRNEDISPLKSMVVNEGIFRKNRGVRFSICYEFSLKKIPMTTFTAGGNGKTTYDRLVIYNQ